MKFWARHEESEEYVIRAALADEANEGWVWVQEIRQDKNLDARTIVTIRQPGRWRSVYVEVRTIDDNFRRQYNAGDRTHICCNLPTIIMSEWYRDFLGLQKTCTDNRTGRSRLSVRKTRICGWRSIRATSHHPDPVVRLATRLGVLGIWLGLLGVWLGLWGVGLEQPCWYWLSRIISVVGALVVIAIPLGILGCIGRPRPSPK